MDPRRAQYDPAATYDDGSCPEVAPIAGCTDSAASNFRARATLDDASCIYVGCMVPAASNYEPSAALPGACTFAVAGCTDSAAANYYSAADADDGSCAYAGCTDSSRPNFDADATIDDGLCAPVFPGCTVRNHLVTTLSSSLTLFSLTLYYHSSLAGPECPQL